MQRLLGNLTSASNVAIEGRRSSAPSTSIVVGVALLGAVLGCSSDPAPPAASTSTVGGTTGGGDTSGSTTGDAVATTTTGSPATGSTTGGTTDAAVTATTAGDATTGGASTTGGGLPEGVLYEACAAGTRVGAIIAEIKNGFSSVSGQYADRAPVAPPVVESEADGCELRVAQAYTCTPECDIDSLCAASSTCALKPTAVDVGTIDVSGLGLDGVGSVSMTPGPTAFYQATPAPPHPVFAPGAPLTLSAAGAVTEAFTLQAKGVDDLVLSATEISSEASMPLALSWTPPSAPHGKILIELDVGHHGGSPAKVHCVTDDDGQFDIPQTLVAELFAYGVWGYPLIEIRRESIASTTVSAGCVEFVARAAPVELNVAIPGAVSCSDMAECAEGQACVGLLCIDESAPACTTPQECGDTENCVGQRCMPRTPG